MQIEPQPAAVLASFYEGCPDAVALYDRSGLLVSCNSAALELGGFNPEQIAGTHYRTHLRADDAEIVDDAFASALNGFICHVEVAVRAASGMEIPVEVHVFPAEHAGSIVGVFAEARDLLALRGAEQSLELNQQRFRSLFEYHPDPIMALKSSGAVSRVNVALESDTGFYGEQLIGKPWIEIVAPECRVAAMEAFALVSRGEASEFESLLLDRAGNRIEVQMKLVPLRVADRVDGAYVIAKNVTAQRTAERAIALQGERIRDLYLAASIRGVSVESQIDNTLLLGCRLFGFDYGYVTRFDDDAIAVLNAVGDGAGVKSGAVFPKDSAPWTQVAGGCSFVTKLAVGTNEFGALVFASREPRPGGIPELDQDLLQLVALFVSGALERAQHSERIAQLAFYDSLTGLPNRVLFDDRIHQTLTASKRYGRGFALMFLDLDDFKSINDGLGHNAGDAVLKAVADRLSHSLRESDTVARFGGDEFVILQPVVKLPEDAMQLARKIVEAMQQPLVIGGNERIVHTSIGIAVYPRDGVTAEELMEHADRALYEAKRSGRNRWRFYEA